VREKRRIRCGNKGRHHPLAQTGRILPWACASMECLQPGWSSKGIQCRLLRGLTWAGTVASVHSSRSPSNCLCRNARIYKPHRTTASTTTTGVGLHGSGSTTKAVAEFRYLLEVMRCPQWLQHFRGSGAGQNNTSFLASADAGLSPPPRSVRGFPGFYESGEGSITVALLRENQPVRGALACSPPTLDPLYHAVASPGWRWSRQPATSVPSGDRARRAASVGLLRCQGSPRANPPDRNDDRTSPTDNVVPGLGEAFSAGAPAVTSACGCRRDHHLILRLSHINREAIGSSSASSITPLLGDPARRPGPGGPARKSPSSIAVARPKRIQLSLATSSAATRGTDTGSSSS